METKTATGFWAVVKRDAVVQERVVLAAKQADALGALVKVAAEAGFVLNASELRRSLQGELSERDLDRVSGGTGAQLQVGSLIEERVRLLSSAPGEWFAEKK